MKSHNDALTKLYMITSTMEIISILPLFLFWSILLNDIMFHTPEILFIQFGPIIQPINKAINQASYYPINQSIDQSF